MYLSRAERRRTIEAAAAILKGKRTLMAGVGALRTDDAVALAKDAEAAGADALLLAPVSYTPLTQEEAYHHFAAVAGATGLPLAIYNNPTTTRFAFSHELLVRLAYIPNIRAIKMPLPADSDYAGELARLRPKLGQDFAIGYSGDWGCACRRRHLVQRGRRPAAGSRPAADAGGSGRQCGRGEEDRCGLPAALGAV
jgi:4-hydroxy-tetrahydrodipicolinate synthase